MNKTEVLYRVGAHRLEDLDLRVSRALHPDDVRRWRDMPLTGFRARSQFSVEEVLEAASRCGSMRELRQTEPVMAALVHKLNIVHECEARFAFVRSQRSNLDQASRLRSERRKRDREILPKLYAL
ncbi:MAG: hypothetical protein ACE37M_07920 [Henriciella sp.]